VAATKLDDGTVKSSYRIEIGANSVEAALGALTTQAAPWQHDDDVADDAPLVPTQSDQQLRAGRALGRDLARSIELLPGVLRARVHVSFPAPNLSLADPNGPVASAPSVAILLLLTAAHTRAVDEQVRTLVAGAVPGLPASAIAIVETVQSASSTHCAELARIGPVSVTRTSERTLKAWLGIALSVHMLLAATLLFSLSRPRRKQP
jgi:flagellar biosynthesis/type III secretory pathway M-ring protein FliF/YscJ